MHSTKRGLFIVTDGIDGSGKTTQARMLVKWLKKQGKKVVFTHEPMRTTKLGRYIEKRIRDNKNKTTKEELLKLFTQDRRYHLKHEILPALKKGRIVISDRYYYSTFAYQLPESKWKSYAKPFLKPDLAFIFEVPEKIAMKRVEKSISGNERRFREKAIFEKEKFLKKLRKKFLRMRKFREARIIDGTPKPEIIFESVKKEVERR